VPWFPTRAVSVVSWMPKLTPVMVSGARPLAGAFAGVERVMTAASYEKPSLRVPVMPPTTTYTGGSSQSIAVVTLTQVRARASVCTVDSATRACTASLAPVPEFVTQETLEEESHATVRHLVPPRSTDSCTTATDTGMPSNPQPIAALAGILWVTTRPK
jgi:hypothetical protein